MPWKLHVRFGGRAEAQSAGALSKTEAVYTTIMDPLAPGVFRVGAGCYGPDGSSDGRGFTDALLWLYCRRANMGAMTHSPSTGQCSIGPAPSCYEAWLECETRVKHPPLIGRLAVVTLFSALIAFLGPPAPANAVPANPIVRLSAASVKTPGNRASGDKFACSLGTADKAVAASGRLRLRHDLVGPLRCPIISESRPVRADRTEGAWTIRP